MIVTFHRDFKKAYKKLSARSRRKVDERILVFYENQFHPLLSNHSLKGKYEGYRSINIDGDLRALYKNIRQNLALFIKLGSHADLYE